MLDTRYLPLDTLFNDHQVGFKVTDMRVQSANAGSVLKIDKRI